MSRCHLQVACALLERDGLVLAAQRSACMSLPLKWEFPGGKLDAGETPQQCLVRELQEELGVAVAISRALTPRQHAYPGFDLTLHSFCAVIVAGDLTLHEHAAIAWLAPHELHRLDWAAADLPVVHEYQELVANGPDAA